MVAGGLVSDQHLFWVAVVCMYVFDNIYLLNEREVLVEETLSGSWKLRLSRVPFTLGARSLSMANPLVPWRFVMRMRWLQLEQCTPRTIRRTQRSFCIARMRLHDLRHVSSCSFLSLFALGPALTYLRGFETALWNVLLIHAFLSAWATHSVWCQRRALHMSPYQIAWFVAEFVLFPPYLANVSKRVSSRLRFGADAAAVCLATFEGEALRAAREVLEYRLSDMETEAGDRNGYSEELRAYRDRIGL